MDFSKRYQETTGPFIQSLLKPTKELLDDNKDLSLSQKTELNNKTFVLDINEEHRNSFLNSSKKNNNLNKKFVNSTNVEDFPLTNNKESDEKKSSEINENKELLHDFIKEASDNIAEVLDLLVSKENNLKEAEQSEKLDKERELINSSLIKIRNFQNFLKNLSNHNFSSEISQVLHLHLLDLKSMKAVIKTTFYKDIKKANQTNNARPSIENMTQSNLSFESYKSKIKESLNLTSLTNRNLDTKNKIIDIEKESKDNWIKFRSIHRKDSYVANNENTVLCFEDTYQNFESLIKRELINKDILSDSNQKVDFTQEYSKDLYDKWLEKHDQIVYKDLQDEGVKINNLKVIRNMGDQLDLLKTYLHKSIEKKT